MRRLLLIATFGLIAAATAMDGRAQTPATLPSTHTIVVELYTSQGCMECRRANRLLGVFSHDPNVVALTFPVGYWDYLGWADTLAQPQFSDRQRDYTHRLRARGPFTPELIIDGAMQIRASDWDEAAATLDQVRAWPMRASNPRVGITRLENGQVRVTIAGETPREAPADIWLIAYDPGPVSVWVMTGENANRNVIHYNVVQRITRVGAWMGQSLWFERPRCSPQCAVIVQEQNGGPILGAAMTRRRQAS